MTKYIKKGLPWNNGAGVDVTNCNTAQEVMIQSKLDYRVEKCELMAKMPFSLNRVITPLDEENGEFAYKGHQYAHCPSAYGTYRTDRNIALGIVGEKYEVVQNTDAFNFFDKAIGRQDARWDRACLFGFGERVLITAKLKEDIKVGNDDVLSYLAFSNSFDGSTSVDIMFTAIRAICTNMLNSCLKASDSHIRFKHTISIKSNLDISAQIISAAKEHAKSASELYNALYYAKIGDNAVKYYFAILELNNKQIEDSISYHKDWLTLLYRRDVSYLTKCNISSKKANKIVALWEYYNEGIGQEEIIGTKWGAYNAVTGYYSNVDNNEGSRRTMDLLYGGSNKSSEKALNVIFDVA